VNYVVNYSQSSAYIRYLQMRNSTALSHKRVHKLQPMRQGRVKFYSCEPNWMKVNSTSLSDTPGTKLTVILRR